MYYFRFAHGEGIGPPQEGDLDPLVGLEHLAQLVKTEPLNCAPQSFGSNTLTQDQDVEFFSQNLEALSVGDQSNGSCGGATHGIDLSIEKEDPAELASESGSPSSKAELPM